MDCTEIKELLSEYTDGALDEGTKKLVEEHLGGCKGCSQELASLKACDEELRSLEKLQAPDDLPEKVYEQLRGLPESEKMVPKPFVSATRRVSLQVAGVALVALIGIVAYNVLQPAKKLAYISLAGKREEAAVRVARESVQMYEKEKKIPVFKEAAPQERPIELVLLVPPQTYPGDRAALGPTAIESLRAAPPSAKIKSEEFKETEQIARAQFPRIESLIESLREDAFSLEYKERTDAFDFIIVEVPANRYATLLEKIALFGELQAPPPSVTIRDETILRVRIIIAPSDGSMR